MYEFKINLKDGENVKLSASEYTVKNGFFEAANYHRGELVNMIMLNTDNINFITVKPQEKEINHTEDISFPLYDPDAEYDMVDLDSPFHT